MMARILNDGGLLAYPDCFADISARLIYSRPSLSAV